MPLTNLFKRVGHFPLLGPLALRLLTPFLRGAFNGSSSYWEQRYARGGTSGEGSYGAYANFKADVINRFVREHRVSSVTEFGCGDGNQLALLEYPRYLGIDISPSAIERCRQRFANDASKRFLLYQPANAPSQDDALLADATASLDVIYHLVEDAVFDQYLRDLFAAADRFVIIFSSNTDFNPTHLGRHIKHRSFSQIVESRMPNWELLQHIPNPFAGLPHSSVAATLASFYIYRKRHNTHLSDKTS